MRLTTKGRYAVTAMVDLALHGQDGPVALADIAERQMISLSYLEQLFGRLRRTGLVESVRGPGGGYMLARAMNETTVSDIILAVDEPISATQCGGNEGKMCKGTEHCLTHWLWMRLGDHIYDFLAAVSLDQLVEENQGRTSVMEGPAGTHIKAQARS
ncbi:Rrf2 family transcriptional regulator [Thiohalorhabdus methylotrophus]|uniref:Rrf2 family transcriptional regulator n=1 Tax=Thiohalorhabdus methylotrophus TaxID=3242694 RepID=A0ABV4TWA1_9GAMM